jgi:hypothetical protein
MKITPLVVLFGLLLSTVLGTARKEPASEQPIPPSYFGMHIHHAGKETPWPSVPFHEWRLWDAYVTWPYLEPQQGRWNFEVLDSYVTMAEKNGVAVLLPLGMSPRWASMRPNEASTYQPGNAAPPRDINQWRTYVETVATRYKGRIHQYEIWNEPNLKMFWTGTVDQMLNLTREASEIIHSVDPSAIVVSPSATTVNGVAWLSEFLAMGGGQHVDVIGYHFYVMPQPPEAMVPLVERVRQTMQEHGVAAKPLWNTETGWALPKPFPSDELAAGYLARAVILAWSAGVERFYWYSWDNHTWVTIQTTKTDNRTLRLAGKAYESIYKWLIGTVLTKCNQDGKHVWTCSLERDGAPEWIIWNPDKIEIFTPPHEWRVKSVTPLLGEPRNLRNPNFEIGPVPVLVTSSAEN